MSDVQSFLNLSWVLRCTGLVLMMQAGFICIETGLARAKNSMNVSIKRVVDFCVASIIMLTALKTMGVQLSIDDFVTGYSSLSYMERLPIDRVKIDQSFSHEILTQTHPAPIVRAIIAMAHSLNFLVFAEGVEQEAQRTLLLIRAAIWLKAISSSVQCRRMSLSCCCRPCASAKPADHEPVWVCARKFPSRTQPSMGAV